MAVYDLKEEEAVDFQGGPLQHVEQVASAGIPLLIVAGEADEAVPLDENGVLLERAYKACGGPIQMIVKPGVGHHPHSLEDPQPIVDFVKSAWSK